MMNENKPQDEQEYIEALMMDALDGNLSKSGERELNRFLAEDPKLADMLDSLQNIDRLFSDIEMVEPPAQFVENTMANLPRPTFNRWLMGISAALVMMLALAPVILGVYLVNNISAQEAVFQLTQSFLDGMTQVVYDLTQTVAAQPLSVSVSVIVSAVMIGSIFLWILLYRRMVGSLVRTRS